LIHYQEIDTWTAYKDISIEDISDEVEAFKASQTKLVTNLQTEFNDAITYFQGSITSFTES
jgi:hypothetical protein